MAIAVFLCDESGIAAQPWADAGWTCYCVDFVHSIRRERIEGNVHFVWGDCRSWFPPERPGFLMAFPPCTDLAVSGARDFNTKGIKLFVDAVETFHYCRFAAQWAGCPYAIENPVGRLSGTCGKPEYTFDPCDYAGYLDDPATEAYTKKTCLWTGGGFVMPEPKPVSPILGSKMHNMSPSKDRRRLRAQTPVGFAKAVFEANH